MPVMIESPTKRTTPPGPVLRIFVATHVTQGRRHNDFCFATDDEMTIFPYQSCSEATVDDECGCKRSLVGIRSGGKTTTMKVIVSPVDRAILKTSVRLHLQKSGEWEVIKQKEDPELHLALLLDTLLEAAEVFALGDIVEFRDERFALRSATETPTRECGV